MTALQLLAAIALLVVCVTVTGNLIAGAVAALVLWALGGAFEFNARPWEKGRKD